MANEKNKNNKRKSSHRHVYVKKKIPRKGNRKKKHTETEERHRDMDTEQQTDMDTDTVQRVSIEGSRIINMEKLQKHSTTCAGSITLSGELEMAWHLSSQLAVYQCLPLGPFSFLAISNLMACLQVLYMKKESNIFFLDRWECNLAAVWGQMSTGGGHSQLEETMSVFGVPVMTKTSFIETEKDIGELWKKELKKSMLQAGREEKQLAIEKKSFHEDVPAITVIVDGGWSKRSHKHSYNAKSGVGIIIGKETGKLLYLGVRNWTASSSEIETDIILEGFLEAEKVHRGW